MAKCLFCDREFEGERATARFCSGTCRKAHGRLSVTNGVGVSVTNGEVSVTEPLSVTLDFEKDLKLDLRKDLGVSSWENGIFVLPEITIEQVRSIQRLIGAIHQWAPRDYV